MISEVIRCNDKGYDIKSHFVQWQMLLEVIGAVMKFLTPQQQWQWHSLRHRRSLGRAVTVTLVMISEIIRYSNMTSEESWCIDEAYRYQRSLGTGIRLQQMRCLGVVINDLMSLGVMSKVIRSTDALVMITRGHLVQWRRLCYLRSLGAMIKVIRSFYTVINFFRDRLVQW